MNARAIAIGRGMAARSLTGVRDVVITFRSVVVYFDPVGSDVSALQRALTEIAATAARVAQLKQVIQILESEKGRTLQTASN